MTNLAGRKKIIISAVFIFLLVTGATFAGIGASENTVTIQTVSGRQGQTVSVDVTASNIEMAGFIITVNYDPEYLEPKDASLYIGEGTLTENFSYAEDKMRFHWAVADNITVNQMFRIELEVIKEINDSSSITALYIDPENIENEVLQIVGGVPTDIEVTYIPGGVTGVDSSREDCYIATAVYGSYQAPEVMVLRTFRDEVLMNSIAGRLFVSAYYALSPPVAEYLAEATMLNGWVRSALDVLVGFLVGSE